MASYGIRMRMRSVVRLGAIIFMAAFVLFLLGGSSDGSHPTSVLRHPVTLFPMAPVTSPRAGQPGHLTAAGSPKTILPCE